MGSDNPKGAVAPARTKATMVKYLGVFAVVLVLTVTLSTSPNTRGGGVRRFADWTRYRGCRGKAGGSDGRTHNK